MIEGGQSGEAVESASSDFAFGADLFEESIATESTVVEPAMEGVGAKIWGAIKSIFNAIANFFKNLFKRTTSAEANLKKQPPKSTEPSEIVRKGDPIIIKSSESDIKKRDDAIAKEAEYKKQQAMYSQQKEELEKEKQRALAKCDKAIREYVADASLSFNKYYDAVTNACHSMGDSAMVTVIKKISKSIEDLRNNRAVNISKNEGMNTAGRLYKSNIKSDNRDPIYTRDVNNDLLEIEKVSDRAEKYTKLAQEARELYNQKANRIIQIAELNKNEYISENEIRSKAHVMLRQSIFTTQRDKQTEKALKEIKDVCKDNIEFCTSATQHNYEDLDFQGSSLFFLCKHYLSISKNYGKLSLMIIEA